MLQLSILMKPICLKNNETPNFQWLFLKSQSSKQLKWLFFYGFNLEYWMTGNAENCEIADKPFTANESLVFFYYFVFPYLPVWSFTTFFSFLLHHHFGWCVFLGGRKLDEKENWEVGDSMWEIEERKISSSLPLWSGIPLNTSRTLHKSSHRFAGTQTPLHLLS